MEENNKKSNKGLVVIIVILVILLVGAIGYIGYDKFFADGEEKPITKEQSEEVNNESNFYSIENLVKNKYIKELNSNSEFGEKYIKLENGKVYVLNYEELSNNPSKNIDEIEMIEAKGIEGTPKNVFSDFVQSAYNYLFLVLTEEGDLYYLSTKSDSFEFKKINTGKVLKIYDFVMDNNGVVDYPFKEITFYAELENGKLMEINNEAQMTKTFEEAWLYPDKICSFNVSADGWCEGLVISSDRVLFNEEYDDSSNSYVYEEIKFQNNGIKVKEALSTIDETGLKHYYIISMDDQIYEVVQNDDDSSISSVKLYKDVKVQEFLYSNPDGSLTSDDESVSISYVDGTSEKFDGAIISSLYYRYNNK